MTFINNETLAAYSDGELDDNEAEKVRRALEVDDLLRARLAQLQTMDSQLRAAFAPYAEDAIPRRLRDTLEFTGRGSAQAPKPSRVRRWLPVGSAIAAAAAGVVVGAALRQDTSWLTPIDSGVALAGLVESAAQTTPSGSSVKSGAMTVTPILSFVSDAGASCREIGVLDEKGALKAIACRDGEVWRVEALLRAPMDAGETAYKTAGAKADMFDAVYARLGLKTMLDAKAEHDAIAHGWPEK